MPIESQTEREEIIKLDGKIDRVEGKLDYVVESLERVIVAFEKLEVTRLADHEQRLQKLERWVSEWSGAYKIFAIIGLVLGIIATIKAFI